jgi:hypothetical protein
MEETEQESERTGKLGHAGGRLIVVVLCMLALLVLLVIWGTRPRYYTYISEPTTSHPGYALKLLIPVGWGCKQILDQGYTSGHVFLQIRHKPAKGFAQWWNQNILRLKTDPPSGLDCYVGLDIRPYDPPDHYIHTILQTAQQHWGHKPSGLRPTIRTFEHPLGPALDGIFPGPPGHRDHMSETAEIAARQLPAKGCIRLGGTRMGTRDELSHTQGIWDEMIRSFRIVQR